MQVIRGKRPRPRKCMLYGQHGVGKSTWAAGAWAPLFIDLEAGVDDLDVSRTSQLLSFDSACAAIAEATAMEEFSTLVVDTLDWLEMLMLKHVGQKHGKGHYTEVPFGRAKGDLHLAVQHVQGLLDGAIRAGKAVILLSHCKVTRFENPETDAYDVYGPDLHKDTSELWQEWCDEVLFASFRVFVQVKDAGFGREVAKAKGADERFIRVSKTAASEGKNRLGLSGELPMSFAEYAKHWPKRTAQASIVNHDVGNIAGLVSNGSSKLSNEKTELEFEAEKVF